MRKPALELKSVGSKPALLPYTTCLSNYRISQPMAARHLSPILKLDNILHYSVSSVSWSSMKYVDFSFKRVPSASECSSKSPRIQTGRSLRAGVWWVGKREKNVFSPQPSANSWRKQRKRGVEGLGGGSGSGQKQQLSQMAWAPRENTLIL